MGWDRGRYYTRSRKVHGRVVREYVGCGPDYQLMATGTAKGWPTMAENGRRKGDGALLIALAAGHTVRDAAQLAGIGERTATRRLADPDFRREVSAVRGEMVGRALGKMAEGMADAADTLRRLLTAGSDTVKLGASRAMLELGAKLRESIELEQRLTDLESRLPSEGRKP